MPVAAVRELVQAGRIEEAWQITEDMTDIFHRAEAALVILRETRTLHDFENAMALASHIEDESCRCEMEAKIRQAF